MFGWQNLKRMFNKQYKPDAQVRGLALRNPVLVHSRHRKRRQIDLR